MLKAMSKFQGVLKMFMLGMLKTILKTMLKYEKNTITLYGTCWNWAADFVLGNNSYRGIHSCTGPISWWRNVSQRGLHLPRAPQTNKTWLKGSNSGLFRWTQIFTQEKVRVCHRQFRHHWCIAAYTQACTFRNALVHLVHPAKTQTGL